MIDLAKIMREVAVAYQNGESLSDNPYATTDPNHWIWHQEYNAYKDYAEEDAGLQAAYGPF